MDVRQKKKLKQENFLNVYFKLIIEQLLYKLKGIIMTSLISVKKKIKFKLKKDFLNDEVTILNKKYFIISAIYHHGENPQSGHYTTMLHKQPKYLHVDDMNVAPKSYPGIPEDIYVIFLEII